MMNGPKGWAFKVMAVNLLSLVGARSPAEELLLVRGGQPLEKNIRQAEMDAQANPFWRGWTQRKGQTVDGRFVLERRKKNLIDFPAGKSALGDCEFEAVFSCNSAEYGARGGGRGPRILLADRGQFGFGAKGTTLTANEYKGSLPLADFAGPSPVNLGDGKLHRLSAKRLGDMLTFYVDGQPMLTQAIDPQANLIFSLRPMESAPRIVSIRLTADAFSDKLTTNFKSAAPVEVLFDGSGKPQETVSRQSENQYRVPRIEGREYAPGNAAVYRIPALVVTGNGTLLAFAEARASGFDWGHIRLVVRRSEDHGKTWGPEIDTTGGRFPENKIGNPVPLVDRDTGRIWLIGHSCPAGRVHAGEQQIMLVHSDDDGKTWSDTRQIPMTAWLPRGFNWMLSGPGHGIQLARGEHRGRLAVPCYGHGTGYVVYSDDHGATWTVGATSPNGPYNEAVCVELSNGDVMLNTRSPGGGGGRQPHRGAAVLTDGGARYKEGTARFIPELPCPSCQGGTVRLTPPGSGQPGVLLYAGPGLPSGRVRGTLFASYDDGTTWPYQREIYQGPYGYSDIAVLSDGRVACLFELNKQDLLFTVFDGPPLVPPSQALER